jgi:hypothetical protein
MSNSGKLALRIQAPVQQFAAWALRQSRIGAHPIPASHVEATHRQSGRRTDVQLQVRALESLLTDKGLVDPAALDALVDNYATKVGPRNGAAGGGEGVNGSGVQVAAPRRRHRDAGGAGLHRPPG